uniref:Uncharacterized protein n=1 Tax=Oscillatoriales cyanobacterium SpSt-402 TaxID=2282168 RepID=A0A832M3K5_9CYAN
MKFQLTAIGLFAATTLPLLSVVLPGLAQVTNVSSTRNVREVTIIVERATTEHNFDPNLIPLKDDEKPDFFTRVSIAGETRSSQPLTDRKDAPINFTMTKQLNIPAGNAIPIALKLFDADGTSGDDQADINPGSNRDWVFYYQPSSGNLYLNDMRTVVGQVGRLITLRGNESGKNATISFRVNHVFR